MTGILFPKPATPTKPRKPLLRKTPLKRSTKPIARRTPLRRSRRLPGSSGRDPAALDPAVMLRIWGPSPTCVLTCRNQVEFHHCLGRGDAFGIKKDDDRRFWFSSPFAAVPLSHDVHAGPQRDAAEMRCLLLRLAAEAVHEAMGRGEYEVTSNDRAFRQLAEQWRCEH